jgi:2,5-diketo-D-gluconate reductase A
MTSLGTTVILTHGAALPRIGLGTWPMDDAETERAVASAIEAGYRLVDTAENYGNERGVGLGIRASGLSSSDVFVTTKFNKRWHGRDLVGDACARSAERLGVDVIDLLLMHWPNPGQDRYVEAWEGMVALLESGAVRAIGTSNFKPAHLTRIIEATGVTPDVNQVQLSPLVTRGAVRSFDAQHQIVTQSWSPFGGSGTDVLRERAVIDLAERHGRTPAQIVLRWNLQLGLATVPKTSDPDRMRSNLDVFDFTLSTSEVDALSGLDRGETAAVDSDRFGH